MKPASPPAPDFVPASSSCFVGDMDASHTSLQTAVSNNAHHQHLAASGIFIDSRSSCSPHHQEQQQQQSSSNTRTSSAQEFVNPTAKTTHDHYQQTIVNCNVVQPLTTTSSTCAPWKEPAVCAATDATDEANTTSQANAAVVVPVLADAPNVVVNNELVAPPPPPSSNDNTQQTSAETNNLSSMAAMSAITTISPSGGGGDRALVDLIPETDSFVSPPLDAAAVDIIDPSNIAAASMSLLDSDASEGEEKNEDEEVTPTRRFDMKSLKITVVDDETVRTWAGAYDRSFLLNSSRTSTDTPDPRNHAFAAASSAEQFSLGLSVRQQQKTLSYSAGEHHHHHQQRCGATAAAVAGGAGAEDSYLSQSLSWSNNGSFCSAPIDGTMNLTAVTAFRRDLNEAEQRFRVALDKLRTRTGVLQEASSEASNASNQHGHTFLKMLAVEAHRQNPGKVTPEKLTSLHRLIDERLLHHNHQAGSRQPDDQQNDDGTSEGSSAQQQQQQNHGAYEQSVVHHGDHHHSLAVVLATEQLFFPHTPTTPSSASATKAANEAKTTASEIAESGLGEGIS
ncbi:Hypothetical protein, putative [Bodo saltans]|uniref:Uncharacterized protein n=1 Tax=Bodo saltans TaxID=75058 RepID=A0A0S4JD78_BODSA|nr:Hypothetical protein, putative [Bodo saltans]|eukprot:CUG87144.1 Hypothetical protein, putative [Bodo saltans]